MTKTIEQAGAELLEAARKYSALHKAYYAACETERTRPGTTWELGDTATYSPEWHAACDANNAAKDELTAAAEALSLAEGR